MMGIGWVISLVCGRVELGKAIFFGFFFFFFGYNPMWVSVG
jgi:hypothetical protein